MERFGRVPRARLLSTPSFIFIVLLPMFLARSGQTRSVNVAAFTLSEGIGKRQHYSRAGPKAPGTPPFNSVGGFNNRRNMSVPKNHQLMGHRVGIIGGGLAGLSAAYHLLKKSPSSDITIIDPNSPGTGGASSVAGGCVLLGSIKNCNTYETL